MKAKKGDRVLLDTSAWGPERFERFRVERVGTETIGGTWETGPLTGRHATLARGTFDQRLVEVLPPGLAGGPGRGVAEG